MELLIRTVLELFAYMSPIDLKFSKTNLRIGSILDNPLFQLELGKEVLSIDPAYFRPTEVDLLIGDPNKANTQLNWKPKYDLPALVKEMVISDLQLMKKEEYLKAGGFKTNNYFE